jgi:hypothetical protein
VPEDRAAKGRPKNPTPKAAKAARVPINGSTFGKNKRLNTTAAASPYIWKSYHSTAVPTRLANNTFGVDVA